MCPGLGTALPGLRQVELSRRGGACLYAIVSFLRAVPGNPGVHLGSAISLDIPSRAGEFWRLKGESEVGMRSVGKGRQSARPAHSRMWGQERKIQRDSRYSELRELEMILS